MLLYFIFAALKKLLIPFFLLIAIYSSAQKATRVEVLNADVLEFIKIGNQTIQKLKGNCVFRQDNVTLSCDSALKNNETNTVDAFGHVHIQQGDSLNLYGDIINYDGNLKIAKISNNVRVLHNDMLLTTNTLNYDTKNRVATYLQGGTIKQADNVLVSRYGYYFAKTADAYFKKDVVLTNPKYVMNSDTLKYNSRTRICTFFGSTTIKSDEDFLYAENGTYNTITDVAQFSKNAYYTSGSQKLNGDLLYYDRKKGIGRATNNITFIDTAQKIILKGNKAVYNRLKETAIVTNKAYVIALVDNDSLFMSADTLRSFMDSTMTYRTLLAYHDVRAFKSDLQARCDSLSYTYKDSTMSCFKEPTIWSQNAQMTADFITLQLKNKVLDKMNLYNSAFLVMIDSLDSTKFDQIRGKNMFGNFVDSKLQKLFVEGNGQSVYYAKEEDGEYIGVNRADCSNMLVSFSNNKVEKVNFITKPDATFFPIDELKPEELKLKGFSWRIKKKPLSKEDVIKRK